MTVDNHSNEADHQLSESAEKMTIEGVVERSPLGTGTWSIVGAEQTVEIFQAQPEAILQEGLRVRVTGKTRPDVMTLAMIGPVFEIDQFQILDKS